MKAKEYQVLDMAVESGVRGGWHRAHKHTDKPTPEAIQEAIVQAVLNDICEWFEFDTPAEDE